VERGLRPVSSRSPFVPCLQLSTLLTAALFATFSLGDWWADETGAESPVGGLCDGIGSAAWGSCLLLPHPICLELIVDDLQTYSYNGRKTSSYNGQTMIPSAVVISPFDVTTAAKTRLLKSLALSFNLSRSVCLSFLGGEFQTNNTQEIVPGGPLPTCLWWPAMGERHLLFFWYFPKNSSLYCVASSR